jgi:diguanylate cyclase (GGDEF)-like protein
MAPDSWLVPTELDRARVVDAHGRMRRARAITLAALGITLLVMLPWDPWWTILLLVVAAVPMGTFELRLKRSAHPERLSAQTLLITLTVLAIGAAGTGGPESPGLVWLVIPCAMAATRFRGVVVVVFAALTSLVILGVSVPVDPQGFAGDPRLVLCTLALLVIVTTVTAALTGAELQHRDNAVLDPLTGLLNRHALELRMAELEQQARLTGGAVCVVLCDLDAFKRVNDTYGHDRGDAVLRDSTYEMRKALRSFELVYRIGGEEFVVLLPGADLSQGVQVADRLREAIEDSRPGGLKLTMSLGVASASGQGVGSEPLMRAADAALYRAKRAGRNRVEAAGHAGGDRGGDGLEFEADDSAAKLAPGAV